MCPHGDRTDRQLHHGCAGLGGRIDKGRTRTNVSIQPLSPEHPRGDNVVRPGAQGGPLHPQQEQSWDDVLIHLVHTRDPVFANTGLMLCGAPHVMAKTSQPTSRSCTDLL